MVCHRCPSYIIFMTHPVYQATSCTVLTTVHRQRSSYLIVMAALLLHRNIQRLFWSWYAVDALHMQLSWPSSMATSSHCSNHGMLSAPFLHNCHNPPHLPGESGHVGHGASSALFRCNCHGHPPSTRQHQWNYNATLFRVCTPERWVMINPRPKFRITQPIFFIL